MVFVSDRAGRGDLWAVDLDGGPAARLMGEDASLRAPHWDAGSEGVTFVRDLDGEVTWRRRPAPVRLATRTGNDWSPAWSPVR